MIHLETGRRILCGDVEAEPIHRNGERHQHARAEC
jgi:hypothetical protein